MLAKGSKYGNSPTDSWYMQVLGHNEKHKPLELQHFSMDLSLAYVNK